MDVIKEAIRRANDPAQYHARIDRYNSIPSTSNKKNTRVNSLAKKEEKRGSTLNDRIQSSRTRINKNTTIPINGRTQQEKNPFLPKNSKSVDPFVKNVLGKLHNAVKRNDPDYVHQGRIERPHNSITPSINLKKERTSRTNSPTNSPNSKSSMNSPNTKEKNMIMIMSSLTDINANELEKCKHLSPHIYKAFDAFNKLDAVQVNNNEIQESNKMSIYKKASIMQNAILTDPIAPVSFRAGAANANKFQKNEYSKLLLFFIINIYLKAPSLLLWSDNCKHQTFAIDCIYTIIILDEKIISIMQNQNPILIEKAKKLQKIYFHFDSHDKSDFEGNKNMYFQKIKHALRSMKYHKCYKNADMDLSRLNKVIEYFSH